MTEKINLGLPAKQMRHRTPPRRSQVANDDQTRFEMWTRAPAIRPQNNWRADNQVPGWREKTYSVWLQGLTIGSVSMPIPVAAGCFRFSVAILGSWGVAKETVTQQRIAIVGTSHSTTWKLSPVFPSMTRHWWLRNICAYWQDLVEIQGVSKAFCSLWKALVWHWRSHNICAHWRDADYHVVLFGTTT